MNFTFTYGPGTTLQQMISFETAGRLWASYLTDDVTINIQVEPSSTLPVGVAGGALMGIEADQSYATWRTRLAADQKTANDQVVNRGLPSNTSTFTAWVNEAGPDGMTSNKLPQTGSTLNLSRANAKALGMRGGQETGLDGYILMSSELSSLGLNWNYSLSGVSPSNSIDFLSVAVHEIGHVLGFYSGVDASGWQLTPIAGFGDDDDDDDGNGSSDQDPRGPLRNATGLDMLRFSNENQLDLVVGGSPFFSVNGGTTKLADFATGLDRNLGGDGFQASHWKSSGGSLGIMEPDIDPGSRRSVTGLDRQSLDSIGWDLGSAVPSLVALEAEAKQAIAQRLGVTVAQLLANPNLAQQLTQDRSQDVAFMVGQSQIYEWRRSRRSRSSGWWHEISPDALAANSIAAGSTDVLTTGWSELTPGQTDSLTAEGRQQIAPAATPVTPTTTPVAEASTSLASSPTLLLGNPLAIAPVNALMPDYLIGAELLQLAF